MEMKTCVFCSFALFATVIDFALTDDGKVGNELAHEQGSQIQKRMAPSADEVSPYELSDDDINELIKRGSLFRFGKRGSILRFGKRGSLLRFGKRRSLFRYGKRFDDENDDDMSAADYDGTGSEVDKRGSLFRFGKRPALFRYGRSVDKNPHTPFRFGREEDES